MKYITQISYRLMWWWGYFTLMIVGIVASDGQWQDGLLFLCGSFLFWWSGSGLKGALIGKQYKFGIAAASLFIVSGWWALSAILDEKFFLGLNVFIWATMGFVFSFFATDKSHVY